MFVDLIQEINDLVKSSSFFELSVYQFEGERLIIAGGKDLNYYHELEIIFTGVTFIQIKRDFRLNTSTNFLHLLSGKSFIDFNKKHKIEAGHYIFQLCDDDFVEYYVASKSIDFQKKIVKYY